MPPVEIRHMHREFFHDFSETLNYATRQNDLGGFEVYALSTGRLTFAERCALLIKFHHDWKLPSWVPTSNNIGERQLSLMYDGHLINSDPKTYHFYDVLRPTANMVIKSINGPS